MQGSPAHVKHGAHFFYPPYHPLFTSMSNSPGPGSPLQFAFHAPKPPPRTARGKSRRACPQSPCGACAQAPQQKSKSHRHLAPPAAQHGISDILIRWENKSTRPAWMSKCRDPDANGKHRKRESEGSMGVSPVWALITVSTRIRRN